MSILDVKKLDYYYQDGDNRRYVLKNINYTFEKGKMYAILGTSGSGKTTLLSLVSGLDKPSDGTIKYEGETLDSMDLNTYRRNKVGIVFQNYNLVPYMTALENVLIAMSITENEVPKNAETIAANLLDYVGISKSKAERLVTKLSGGEQQRVAIARALSTNVDLILADEPTGNLDAETEIEIVNILKNLAKEYDKCVIVVTHSPDVAKAADEIIKLSKGLMKTNE